MRLTLEQRRTLRRQIQMIASFAAKGTTQEVLNTYIETAIDVADYEMDSPAWQSRLRARAERKGA